MTAGSRTSSTLRGAQIRLSNVEVFTHAKAGNAAAEAILDVADEVDADLIVVGTRGIDSKSRIHTRQRAESRR